MPDTLLPLDPATPAVEVAKTFDLGEEAEALLNDGLSADQFFHALQKNRLYFDAIRMLATVLHKLYAVEWAYSAARSPLNQDVTEEDLPLLDVVEKWIAEPTEANRREAMMAAESGGYETPACWAAAAAGWTGGSLAPPELPVVPPADNLTSKAVSGAISMIAVQNSAQIEKRAGQLVDLGLEYAAKPVPEPLYSGAQPAPQAPPPEKPKQVPPPPPRQAPPPPAPEKKPEHSSTFKGLRPTTPTPAAPVRRPPPRAPEPPPPSSPGTWSTDPL